MEHKLIGTIHFRWIPFQLFIVQNVTEANKEEDKTSM